MSIKTKALNPMASCSSWKVATPQSKQLNVFSGRKVSYCPPELRNRSLSGRSFRQFQRVGKLQKKPFSSLSERSINCSKSLEGNSFGFHAVGSGSVERVEKLKAVNEKINTLSKIAIIGLIGLTFFCSAGLIPLFLLIGGVITMIKWGGAYIAQQEICKTAGVVISKQEQIQQIANLQPGPCEALATEHSADTELWRNRLIEAAEENIVISGNYCGGQAFLKTLDLIEEQLSKKDRLKVVIISSPRFLSKELLEKIDDLSTKFKGRFELIQSPDIWHISPGIKKTTNHTKCTVIDYGKYFILGGSGIKDNFAGTGLEDVTKEQFLGEQNVTSRKTKEKAQSEDGPLSWLLGEFRDMDFVFRSHENEENPVGMRVYQQMLLLSYRWQQYHQFIQKAAHETPKPPFNIDQLRAFNGQNPLDVAEDDSVTVKLLKTSIPSLESLKTTVDSFDQSSKKSSDVQFQVFSSGPEQNRSEWVKELLKLIRTAKKEIVINHMYFHPTPEVMKALIDAANRGVKIKIITCGPYAGSPKSHYGFGPRNKHNYVYLKSSLPDSQRKNIEVYKFKQKNIGSHKKAIVIDQEYVIAGSSNFGYKSLTTSSDHELNFIAKSKAFAEQTLEVFAVDIAHSTKTSNYKMTIPEYLSSAFHRLIAPLIG